MRSISRVPVPWITAPAPRKRSGLKREWKRTCRSAPPSPSAIHSGRAADRPRRATPIPVETIPTFSMLE